MTVARLTRPLADAIRAGHPWVFADAVRIPKGTRVGHPMRLVDTDGSFVAMGTADPNSPLAFRVWSTEPHVTIDQALITERLRDAVAYRRDVVPPEVTGYRVCHGENDQIPGLHCDWYDGVASLRTDGEMGAAWEPSFLGAVREVLSPRAIVVRNRTVQNGAARVVAGTVDGEVVISERGRRFSVDLLEGQKTGFFLDQRENRDRVAALAPGRRVLNVFAYTGGFSVAAALAGARHVTTVDIARPAVEAAAANFALNGVDPTDHAFVARDAFDVLAELGQNGAAPDLIVLDPPSFVRNRASRERGFRAYRKLNEMAFRGLPAGGWLCTASCSSHVHDRDFRDIVRDAAFAAGREARVAGVFGAGPDHPVRMGFPEGGYLQFAMVRVR